MGTASHNSGVCEMLQKCLVHFCTENYAATADIEIDAIICLSVVNSSQQNVIKVHKVLPKQCFKNKNNSTFFVRNSNIKHSLQMQLKKKKKHFSRQSNLKKKLLLSHTRKETQGKCSEHVFPTEQRNRSHQSPLSNGHLQERDEHALSPDVRDRNLMCDTDCDLSCEASQYLQVSENDDNVYTSSSSLEKESERSVCVVSIKSEPQDSNWLEENSFNKDHKVQEYGENQGNMNERRESSAACLIDSEQRTTGSPLKEISSPESLDRMYISVETEQSHENLCGTHKDHTFAHGERQDSVPHESQSLDYILFNSSSNSNQQYILEEACLQSSELGIKQEPVSPHDGTNTLHGLLQQSVLYRNKNNQATKNGSNFEIQEEIPSFRNSEKYISTEDDGNEYGQFERTSCTQNDQQDWISTKSKGNKFEDPSVSALINSGPGLSVTQSYDSSNSKTNGDRSDSEQLQHFLNSRDSEPMQYFSPNISVGPNSSLSRITDSATPCNRLNMSQYGDGFSLLKWRTEHFPTQQKKFFCEKCGTGFMSKKSKIRHVRHTCGSNTFQCSLCGKSYSRSDSKQRHMWKMHGLKIQSHFSFPSPKLHGVHDESNTYPS